MLKQSSHYHTSLPLKFEDKMTVELWVIESFTLLRKVRSGIIKTHGSDQDSR